MINDDNAITSGVIWKQLLIFFFPILFGTFFQQLYNTADAIIVGQFLGKEALAAVGGGTSTIINLLVGFFTGIATGSTVIISQFFGARDMERTNKAIHTAIGIALAGGIIIAGAGFFTTEYMLNLIGTPDDVMPLAEEYMKIFFLGSVFNTLYNMGSGVFRALGDSKKPLYFLIVSCAVNIVLDILFVGPLKMGVAGAAWATISSQMISALLCLVYLRKEKEEIRYHITKTSLNPFMVKRTMQIGLPAGIQSVLYTISNLILQAHVNGFGTDTAAAWAAYGKIDSLFWLAINAFGLAVTTFIGQNYGAGLYDRVRKGVRTSVLMASVLTISLSILFMFFGRFFLMLFASDEQVLSIGMSILILLVPTWITYMPIEVFSGAMRGCGKTLIPTIITCVGICGFRIIWLEGATRILNTIGTVMFCYPSSWLLASVALIVYYKKGNILNDQNKRV
ncbi:MAG TPA: MATE family efflux transporter [Candidatus Ornithospirochaeta avicola]|uniref:Multidrug-efflux transporter n=1 Tax=Candidatus Ornithospirochaeta avicola TaxID=2840896 RepID=A0A9D1TMZ5_9SPIO|nr:MATE family efflux transporter [Candidatus Ornithospirochaeta avicola]